MWWRASAMGSAGSKSKTTSSSPSSSSSSSSPSSCSCGGRRRRRRVGLSQSKGKSHSLFSHSSSCLGSHNACPSPPHVCDNNRNKQNPSNASPSNEPKLESCNNTKLHVGHSHHMPCHISDPTSTVDVAATPSSAQSFHPSSGRFLSRFSFIPSNLSFRLTRANSLGSSTSYPTLLNNDDDITRPAVSHGRDDNQQRGDLLPLSTINPTTGLCCQDESSLANLHLNTRGVFSNCSADDRASSYARGVARNDSSSGIDVNLCSPRNLSEMENGGIRVSDRSAGAREPIDRNVRFSRTLSVGRLRDRVLRRSSLSDISFCPVQQQQQQQVGEVRDTDHVSGVQAWEDQTRTLVSDGSAVASTNSSAYPSSSLSNSFFSIQDYEVATSRPSETRYHDLLEHRSNFLERRRRIRSQVRALQRLGSRFENLPGHERTCILSGQHRTGRCTCRTSSRDPHLNDDTSARASISRIVMLAEALFEVLDEIHQQSVVLSSRPSVSSIGSVPAPSEVVESLPVKLYAKLPKHQNEEVAQCYICLVEYEEGDRMRILPCHHEFHKTCVDKWLKEIHRVCPLCRGDICRSDSLPTDD